MKALFIFAVLVCLSSCQTINFFSEPLDSREEYVLDSVFQYQSNYEYEIQTNDKISMSVWGHDDLSVGSVYGIYNSNEVYGKWLLVDAEGYIELPQIGSYYVRGSTIVELKKQFRNRYSYYIKNPIIDIKVLNKQVTIMGDLRETMVVNMDEDETTLMETLARAKALEFYSDITKVLVLRQDGPNVKVAKIDLSLKDQYLQQNIQLFPGDVVVVPSKKYKVFDRRVTDIIPFATVITAAAILMSSFN